MNSLHSNTDDKPRKSDTFLIPSISPSVPGNYIILRHLFQRRDDAVVIVLVVETAQFLQAGRAGDIYFDERLADDIDAGKKYALLEQAGFDRGADFEVACVGLHRVRGGTGLWP